MTKKKIKLSEATIQKIYDRVQKRETSFVEGSSSSNHNLYEIALDLDILEKDILKQREHIKFLDTLSDKKLKKEYQKELNELYEYRDENLESLKEETTAKKEFNEACKIYGIKEPIQIAFRKEFNSDANESIKRIVEELREDNKNIKELKDMTPEQWKNNFKEELEQNIKKENFFNQIIEDVNKNSELLNKINIEERKEEKLILAPLGLN
ncbi:MAG: hypothetical protein GY793_11575 [Proteobacteria bacterium]|nr:hypothetical protein [Pseudomonadota bacterium]